MWTEIESWFFPLVLTIAFIAAMVIWEIQKPASSLADLIAGLIAWFAGTAFLVFVWLIYFVIV